MVRTTGVEGRELVVSLFSEHSSTLPISPALFLMDVFIVNVEFVTQVSNVRVYVTESEIPL